MAGASPSAAQTRRLQRTEIARSETLAGPLPRRSPQGLAEPTSPAARSTSQAPQMSRISNQCRPNVAAGRSRHRRRARRARGASRNAGNSAGEPTQRLAGAANPPDRRTPRHLSPVGRSAWKMRHLGVLGAALTPRVPNRSSSTSQAPKMSRISNQCRPSVAAGRSRQARRARRARQGSGRSRSATVRILRIRPWRSPHARVSPALGCPQQPISPDGRVSPALGCPQQPISPDGRVSPAIGCPQQPISPCVLAAVEVGVTVYALPSVNPTSIENA